MSKLSHVLALALLLSGCNADDGKDTDPTDVDDTDIDTTVDDTDDDAPVQGLVQCDNPVPAASSGVCDVTPGTAGGLLIRGIVLTPEAIYRDGGVLVDSEGMITCVGCDCETPSVTVVDCAEGVVSPGLINPHEHITFSERAPFPASDTRYNHRHDWRARLSTPSNEHGTGSDSPGTRWAEVRHLIGGVTTMVGSGGAQGMVRNPDRGYDEGLDLPNVRNATFPLGDSNRTFHADCDWNFGDTARDVATYDAYISHVAEGIDTFASEEFRCQSTNFDGGQDLTRDNVAHIHSIGLTTEEYDEMARSETKLVWSPRSNIALYGHTADVLSFDRLGGIIALGTDWSYTGSIHSVRELACADYLNQNHYNGYFSDADLWRMATLNAAIAIGVDGWLGALQEGLAADVVIYDATGRSPHRAVIEAESVDTALVLRGGQPLYGEADTLDELGHPCDAVDVCGAERAICASEEWGTTWASLVSQTPGAYPAFFCDTVPTDEPTCVPSRPGEFTGESTADDPDGDGIPNALDNCPDVFNPIRVIDGGFQPDADADDVGDSCDESPLPPDLDADGTLNLSDNCPRDSNPDQSDLDGDGLGDVCDLCPEEVSVDGFCPVPVVTIATVRTATSTGTPVSVEGVVTGLSSVGFSVQDELATGPNNGIYVYLDRTPNVSIGDLVRVEGTRDEYFDELQIASPTVNVLGQSTVPAPTELTSAQAATEDYEGMLVRVTDTDASNLAYDCSVDGSCSDPGLWEVGGPTGVVVFDRMYQGSDWSDHIGELPITGVMTLRWDRRRIMPRTAADFGN